MITGLEDKDCSMHGDVIFHAWMRGYLECRAQIKGGQSCNVTDEDVNKMLTENRKWIPVRKSCC